MAHRIYWQIEKRLIMLIYEGEVDNVEMEIVNQELESFLAQGEKPVHLISDDIRTTKLNTNLNSIIKTFTVLRQPGWGYLVTVGTSIRTRFFFNTLKVLLNMNMVLFASIEEALVTLKKLDSTLNDEVQVR
jgi:hypothetical protein